MKKVIIGGVIIVAVGIMIVLNLIKNGDSDGPSIAKGRTQAVDAEVVSKDTITSSIIITGTVEEETEKSVFADGPLDILEVLVEKGDSVKKGDPLFTVDLDSLKKELEQQRNALAIQILTMEKISAVSAESDDTAMVVALEQAKLSKDSAQRAYDRLTEELEKNKALFDGGYIAAFEYDIIEQNLNDAESQLASAALSYQRSQAELSSMRKTNREASASMDFDRAIQEKTIEGIRMSIESLEKEIADIEAMAITPMDGIITALTIKEGETSETMTPLVVIADTDDLKIVANIREYDISEIALDQQVMIIGDALREEDQVIGKVTYIAPVAAETIVDNRQVTAIEVEIGVIEGVEYLKPGYTTDCEIITSKLEDAVVVSYDMLTTNDDGEDMVFVIDDEGIARERLVELGVTSDFDAEVVNGLEAGETVVVSPSLTLFEGTKVEINHEEEEGD